LGTILFLAIGSFAQDTVTTVDTSYQVTTAPDEEYDDDDSDENSYLDTLKQSYRSVVYDSVFAINNDKGFYYRKYIDSLLRASQVKIENMNARQISKDSLEKIRREKGKDQRQQNDDDNGFFVFDSALGVIFWIIAIAIFGFIIFKLFLNNSSFFSRSRKNISNDIDVTEDTDPTDIDELLRNAIKAGNYRLAVRYLYLQTLTRLSERKLIGINSNKTNYEYVNEVRKHKFANEFASLTLKYEYVWYGEYPVDEKLFEQLQDGFNQFNKNITR
jgi:hypothetical protein